MAKVLSVGGLATAGALVVAGAAVNRLFRPFDATVPRAERLSEPMVLTFPIEPRVSPDELVGDSGGAAGGPVTNCSSGIRLATRSRSARPMPAVLAHSGASRKAWRCP